MRTSKSWRVEHDVMLFVRIRDWVLEKKEEVLVMDCHLWHDLMCIYMVCVGWMLHHG